MNMTATKISRKRAVSTIIGSFFFIVIMLAAFTAFIAMMNTNNDLFRTQLTITDQEISKAREEFILSACTDDNRRLKVFVENVGVTPVEIVDLFIINKTEPTKDVYRTDITFDDSFVPVAQRLNVLESQNIGMESFPNHYDIKVVSAVGNSEIISLPVSDPAQPDDRLAIRLIVDPPEISNSGNVTVIMNVYNRGNHTLYDVQPASNPSISPISVSSQGVDFTKPDFIKRLDPNESTVFIWNYELFGPVGTKVTMTGQAKAKLCEDITTYNVKSATNSTIVDIARDADILEESVGPQLPFSTPKMFISFPNPMGDDKGNSGRGTFAISIVNPTNQSLSVSQVAFFINNPKGSSLIKSITGIYPTSGWSASTGDNLVFWRSLTSQEHIPKYSLRTFVAEIDPISPSAGSTPLNQIFVNAYTSFGQIAETTQSIGAEKEPTVIAQVYQMMSNSTSGGRIYNVTGLLDNRVYRFNFTLENAADSSEDEAIETNSFMLINIPAGFTILPQYASVGDTAVSGGSLSAGHKFALPTVSQIRIFDDGSRQIPVRVQNNIKDGEKAWYSIPILLPDIDEQHLYLFHIGTNGTAQVKCSGSGCSNSEPDTIVGAQSGTIIQVCISDTDCPKVYGSS